MFQKETSSIRWKQCHASKGTTVLTFQLVTETSQHQYPGIFQDVDLIGVPPRLGHIEDLTKTSTSLETITICFTMTTSYSRATTVTMLDQTVVMNGEK